MPKIGLQRERAGRVGRPKRNAEEPNRDDEDNVVAPAASSPTDKNDLSNIIVSGNKEDRDNSDEEEEEGIPESHGESPSPTGEKGDDDEDLAAAGGPAATSTPQAKFQPMDHVIARDRDGVMYDAVVRRAMYGRGQAESIQLGFCSHAEAQLLQEQASDEPPCWHYFIHYNQWRSNWDRWVREYDVYEVNGNTIGYAARVMEAHKKLRKEMTRKIPGKKTFQTIDGAKFLQEWRKRLNEIDAELKINNPRFDITAALRQAQDTKKDTKSGTTPMSKAALLEARRLRERGLTKKSRESDANMISLPFGLKKALVDQWEIITQCGMVTDLPAKVTVRDSLNEYLRSKGVDPELCKHSKKSPTKVRPKEWTEGKVVAASDADKDAKDGDAAAMEVSPTQSSKVDGSKDKTENSAVSQKDGTPMELDSSADQTPATPPKSEPEATAPAGSASNLLAAKEDGISENQADEEMLGKVQGWIDMANGVAQFFDEALPYRLLYQEEYPQFRVVQRTEELTTKPYSEIYGCEYLLRMLTRLPGVLLQKLTAEECRPIFAKLNDLARFLHKNQSHFFAAYHRRPNGDEQMEAMRMQQKKRHRGQRELPTHKLAAKKAKQASLEAEDGKQNTDTPSQDKEKLVVEKTDG